MQLPKRTNEISLCHVNHFFLQNSTLQIKGALKISMKSLLMKVEESILFQYVYDTGGLYSNTLDNNTLVVTRGEFKLFLVIQTRNIFNLNLNKQKHFV